MQAKSHERRNVLVTGGTSGLGRAVATGFASAGWAVMICGRSGDDCHRVAKEIALETGTICFGIPCDISRIPDIEMLAAEVGTRFGTLHALVNNAGAVAPGTLEEISEAAWDAVLDVNVKGAFFLTQKLAPCLRKAGTPGWPASVINISSYAGARVAPNPHYPYSTSKAALNMLTQALAKGMARDGINVNAIALGVFPDNSRMLQGYDEEARAAMARGIPAGRLGRTEDIVAVTAFLASSASSYITGATIPLDGGMHL